MTRQRGRRFALVLGLATFLVLTALVAVSRDRLLPLFRYWTAPPEPPPHPRIAYDTSYRVREGDTVVTLARRFYGDANKYWWILEANPRLKWGWLAPGKRIWIPATLEQPETKRAGTVRRGTLRTRLRPQR